MYPLLCSSPLPLSPPSLHSPTSKTKIKVLPPTSFASRLKEYSETRKVFGILGVLGMAIMLAFGMYSWFDPPAAVVLADIVSAFGEALAVGGTGVYICSDAKPLSGTRYPEITVMLCR